MKLGIIINNQNVIEKIRDAQLPASKVFKIRKAMKQFSEEIKEWEELKNNYISEHGEETENGGKEIKKKEDVQKFIEWANEVLETEIVVDSVTLTEDDFVGMELSVKELDGLEALGLV